MAVPQYVWSDKGKSFRALLRTISLRIKMFILVSSGRGYYTGGVMYNDRERPIFQYDPAGKRGGNPQSNVNDLTAKFDMIWVS